MLQAARTDRDGEYTFYLDSDDGSRLSIDGKAMIEYDGIHGEGNEQSAKLTLKAGRTPIRVELDSARLRPSDNPIIAGDRSRIGSETGWEPRIPIQQTLDDLLDYWRAQTARQS